MKILTIYPCYSRVDCIHWFTWIKLTKYLVIIHVYNPHIAQSHSYRLTRTTRSNTFIKQINQSNMAPLKCPRKDCKWTTGEHPESVWSELLRVHGDEHRESFHAITSNQSNEAEKMKQPSISTGCTAEEWAFFLTEWSDYKQLTKPSEEDTSRILLQCCDTELRRNLHRYHGNLGTKK